MYKSMAIIVLFLGVAYSQEVSVSYMEEWERNDNNTLAGARGVAVYPEIGNGTCTLQFPGPVFWFHCENCDIVPANSRSIEGTYGLSASNKAWQETGEFMFVVNFMDESFNASSLTFTCDPSDTNTATVYSFPNNMDQESARSRIYDNTLTGASQVTIDFPVSVQNFTVDHPNTFEGGPSQYLISNLEAGQKEIWFQFLYTEEGWFSAADIVIDVIEGGLDEEESRKRRNAHF